MKRLLALIAAAIGLALTTGCTHVQLDNKTTGEFKLGELQVFVDRDFATVHDAAVRGLKDLNLFQTKDERGSSATEGEVNARDSADQIVIVKIKELSPRYVSMKIRYGIPGDLAPAQKVYAAIGKHL